MWLSRLLYEFSGPVGLSVHQAAAVHRGVRGTDNVAVGDGEIDGRATLAQQSIYSRGLLCPPSMLTFMKETKITSTSGRKKSLIPFKPRLIRKVNGSFLVVEGKTFSLNLSHL